MHVHETTHVAISEATQETVDEAKAKVIRQFTRDRLSILKILVDKMSHDYFDAHGFEFDSSTLEGIIAQMLSSMQKDIEITLFLFQYE